MGNLKEKMLKGVFWSAVEKYSGMAVSLIVAMILARLLCPEDYGVVAVVQIFLGFLNMLSSMGIAAAIVQRKDLTDDDLSNIFTFSIIVALVLSLVMFGGAWGLAAFYDNPQILPVCQLLAFSVFFSTINMVPHALMTKNLRFKEMAMRTLVVQSVTGVLSIAAALAGWGVYALLVGSILGSLFTFLIFRHYYPVRISRHLSMQPLRKIMSFSAYQFAFDFFNYFSGNLDKLIIGKLMPLSSLAYYEKSYRLMQMPLQNISSVVGPVIQPIMSSFQDDKADMAQKYNRIIKLLATVSFPLAITLYFTADELIFLLFGSQWQEAVEPFKVFALSLPLQMILNTSGGIWQACNATNYMFWTGMCNTLLVCLGFFLGAWLGGTITWIAWGWTCASVICFFNTYWFMYHRLLGFPLHKMLRLFLPPLANLILLAAIYFVEESLVDWQNAFIALAVKGIIAVLVSCAAVQVLGQYDIRTWVSNRDIKNMKFNRKI